MWQRVERENHLYRVGIPRASSLPDILLNHQI